MSALATAHPPRAALWALSNSAGSFSRVHRAKRLTALLIVTRYALDLLPDEYEIGRERWARHEAVSDFRSTRPFAGLLSVLVAQCICRKDLWRLHGRRFWVAI